MRKLLWDFRDDDPVTLSPMNTTETPVVSNSTPSFQDSSEDGIPDLDLKENSETPSTTDNETNLFTTTEESVDQDDVKVVTLSPTNVTSPTTKPEIEQELVEDDSATFPPQNPNSNLDDEGTGLVLTQITSKDDDHLADGNDSSFPKVNTTKNNVSLFNKTKTEILHPKRPSKDPISPGSSAFKHSVIEGIPNFGNTSLVPFSNPKPDIEDLSPKAPTQVSVKLKSYFLCKI